MLTLLTLPVLKTPKANQSGTIKPQANWSRTNGKKAGREPTWSASELIFIQVNRDSIDNNPLCVKSP